MTADTLLQATVDVARLMGSIALKHYSTDLIVDQKSDGSPVTAADRDAERAAREWIAKHFPDDGILGEEYGEDAAKAGRRWTLDPVDGTKSFVRRVPMWASLVAISEGTTVLAGAAYYPAVGELIAAAPGAGCWWNDARCAVSNVSAMRDAAVLTTDERYANQATRRDGWHALADAAFIARTWGDAYGYLLVATGRAEVMVDPVANPWDAAPFLPIITEAGGVFSDWSGQRTPFAGSAIATNRSLAADARRLLGAGAVRDGAMGR